MTLLDPRDLATFRALQGRAPFRLQMPQAPQVRDVTTLLVWLEAYLSTVERAEVTLRADDRERARAVTVLRGLRRDLANAVDTLEELDAAEIPGDVEKLADPPAGTFTATTFPNVTP